jgi:hypothetical protein
MGVNPNEAKGRIFKKKKDSWRAKFSENFNDFVDFSLKGQFLEKVEGPQKRPSREACGPRDADLEYFRGEEFESDKNFQDRTKLGLGKPEIDNFS